MAVQAGASASGRINDDGMDGNHKYINDLIA